MKNGEDKIQGKHLKIMEAKNAKMKYIKYIKKT